MTTIYKIIWKHNSKVSYRMIFDDESDAREHAAVCSLRNQMISIIKETTEHKPYGSSTTRELIATYRNGKLYEGDTHK